MVPLGTIAPDFTLTDAVSDKPVSVSDFEGQRGLLVAFACNHCPFVIHVRDGFARLAAEYSDRGVGVVAINANSIETHPQDGPRNMKSMAEEHGWTFPYLFDDTQDVAKAYRAACTPDFFLYDGERRLAYRGQFDASRPSNAEPVTGADLRAATDAVLAGTPVANDQTASIGCNIKWKAGNAPGYA